MEEKRKYDEERELASPWEWVIIIVFSISIILFGLLVYRIVPDGLRQWDFGQLPDTPAESAYSTEKPPVQGTSPPRQIPVLPEAEPLKPPKPANAPLRERGPEK